MPNTSLPTGLNSGSTGHINHANILHAEMNRLTRDTGRRNLASLLTNGWKLEPAATSGIHIERINEDVYLHIRGLDGRASTAPTFIKWATADDGTGISTQFQPYDGVFRSALHRNDLGEKFTVSSTRSGSLAGFFLEKEDSGYFQGFTGGYWRTLHWRVSATYEESWPSFLPPAV